ncbi:hypothetical protein EI94DRAFT_1696112 [Lactarius quietus]|nr:hypothetical protein EI94DRAFT_1696112 [Lactarius quietus]
MKSAAVLWQAFAPLPLLSHSDVKVKSQDGRDQLCVLGFPVGRHWSSEKRSRAAPLNKAGHVQRSIVHPNIGLLYLDSKEVLRKPRATDMAPVKAKAQKDVKREQQTVKLTAGRPKGSWFIQFLLRVRVFDNQGVRSIKVSRIMNRLNLQQELLYFD